MRAVVYEDRRTAGRALAKALGAYHGKRPLVLGIPRGGVIVAAEVAAALDGELDVVVARKIGAPWHPEYALGAVDPDGEVVLGPELSGAGEAAAALAREVAAARAEVERRLHCYRRGPEPLIQGRVVIVVDDGVATGLTARAALGWVRRRRPARLVFGAPVGGPDQLAELAGWCDEIVCPLQPGDFAAVSRYYRRYPAVSDDEVLAALRGRGSGG
ncbi:phosphoribosyltransferase [Caldinitratiruptor microaerophilus]|uniref:Phosphoribosyltransferase n=1 Tax=Caldinitratiruptor microaerophilus TaxID=671077 RepID=A0AA35G6L3_9FIRM|nr:phosphoribosyltransferase family protein [Caldinitratiruptor microaerophilus]BDG59121.1 phosphoribosyltransferase [Caldinitratiruptor microaerophilus]